MKILLPVACIGLLVASSQPLIGDDSNTGAAAMTDAPAYHAKWEPGRGFEPGDTLPDIPLMDLDGNEVRFDQFLGKRYILYGWASW